MAGGRFKKEIVVDGQSYLLLIRDEGGPPEAQVSTAREPEARPHLCPSVLVQQGVPGISEGPRERVAQRPHDDVSHIPFPSDKILEGS